ncbi:hypothetical protein SETIT_4G029500v2 [Setaria italica]|uniref:Uncharacterized protein n=1 Tax=Setaria italica TaxID=4555 RepID=A0A368QQT0_SETIT|nr:hypothetical protein SETIT_4G029500v2 [Setaria italica]
MFQIKMDNNKLGDYSLKTKALAMERSSLSRELLLKLKHISLISFLSGGLTAISFKALCLFEGRLEAGETQMV